MSGPAPVIVAIGSNLGDSVREVRGAGALLRGLAPTGFRASSLWRSRAVDGPPDSPPFVNAVVLFSAPAGHTPESLLHLLQSWERGAGRLPKRILNEPRPLDLDLITFGDEIRRTERLTLPHPRAHQRRFVLQPLQEIAPFLILPGGDLSVTERLAALQDGETLTRIGAV